MDNQNAKKSTKKLLTLTLVMLLVLVTIISMTACSIFTDAVKSVFNGEKAETKTDKDGNSSSASLVVESPSEEGEDEDPGIISTDPVVDVGESEVVTIAAESLVYDKASEEDMQISATHEGKDYYGVIGMGLISDGSNRRVVVTARTRGSSTIVIDGEYLCTLPADNYYIYYCVSDTSGRIYYEPFRLEVVNSVAEPTDLKISYDIDCPNTYVCFRCDCGGAHRVSFDGVNFDAVKGATRTRINTAVDKALSHTAVVTCLSSSRSAEVTKTAPTAEAIDGKYLLEEKSYSYKGHKADAYIEDDAEAADLLEYLAYQGAVTSMKAYVSETIHQAINENASGYLSSIQSAISVPWSLQFGCSYSNVSRVVTFKIEGTNAGATISSGYTDTRSYEKLSVTSHYTPAETVDRSRELAINGKTGVGVRNVKELLAVVEAGYRPIAEDETLALYNKAKDFCYTYLSAEMSDVEKLHVIYDYLAGEIDYDYSALNLFNLIATISQTELVDGEYVYVLSLDEAKDAIVNALAAAELETDPSKKFSSAMVDAINAAMDSVNAPQTTDDLVAALKVDYLQRLSAFSVEGVFDDGAAVCEGISYAFMLLARIEGIECYQITGVASQGNSRVAHAWNKVHLDGKWYCIDATWGNTFFNDTKYVTHRYFMVDDGTFSVDHIETINDSEAAVANLAIGNVEYYKSVDTSAGHTLYVRNNADVEAAVAYFHAAGSHYVEVMVDPSYKPTSGTFGNAYMKAAGTTKYSITSSTTGNVFIAYIE